MRKNILLIFLTISNFLNAQISKESLCEIYTIALNYILENNIIHNYVIESRLEKLDKSAYIKQDSIILKYFAERNIDYKKFVNFNLIDELSKCICIKTKSKFLSQEQYRRRLSKLNFIYRYRQLEYNWFYFSDIFFYKNFAYLIIYRFTPTNAKYTYFIVFERDYYWSIVFVRIYSG